MVFATVLLLAAGFFLGVNALDGHRAKSAAETNPDSSASVASGPVQQRSSVNRSAVDDPQTLVYEPFIECSPGYAAGPGGDLDRRRMIGPDNSVLVSPSELRELGRSEDEIRAQAVKWNKLSAEERAEQLCRAAEQAPLTDR